MFECRFNFSEAPCTTVVAQPETIFLFIVEGRVSIRFLPSHIRYSSYTVATIFPMVFDYRVKYGTVAKSMTRYAYAYTTQMAKSVRVQKLRK